MTMGIRTTLARGARRRAAACCLAAPALVAGCGPMPARAPAPAPAAATGPSPAAPRVAAVVNGEVITLAALEARLEADRDLAAEIAGLDSATVAAVKRDLLAAMIADTLIAQEAHRQGVRPETLRASILRDVTVTDGEVREAMRLVRETTTLASPQAQRRRARLLAGTEAEQRARVREVLRREKSERALETFALALRQQATIRVLLEPRETN